MADTRVEIGVGAICYECGDTLEVDSRHVDYEDIYNPGYARAVVRVKPCERCLAEARKEGEQA